MLPGNVDPRRPDKVQRYKPPTANGNGQDDLTPDYMNILGQRATTANATTEIVSDSKLLGGAGVVVVDSNLPQQVQQRLQQQQLQHRISEDKLIQQQQQPQVVPIKEDLIADYSINANTAKNVIPTSPQYGVAIISSSPSSSSSASSTNNTTTTDSYIPNEVLTHNNENSIIIDNNPKITDDNSSNNINKDNTLHTTPSKNDRFKVVKIASLEPFKRGRWKCMDYMDEVPNPSTNLNQQTAKIAQTTNNIPVSGGVYLQTQSLPQQQIQQMLLQGGYTNGTQYFNNQMLPPQAQFYYQPGTNIQPQTLPQQLINANVGVVQQQQQQPVPSSSIPTQYINTTQPYFTGGGVIQQNATGGYTVHPQANYQPNVQYVPQNIIQPPNQTQQQQNPTFVPTSQNVQLAANFQQSQTYSGQPNVSQANVVTQQPIVNGHAYPAPQPQQQQQQQQQQQPQQPNEQVVSSSSVVQNQTVKNVILNTNVQQPIVSQPQIQQQQQIPTIQSSTPSQSVPVPVMQQQQNQYQNPQNYQPQQQQLTNQLTQQQQIPNQQTQPNSTNQLPPQTQNLNQNQQQQPVIQVQQVVSVPSQTFEQNPTNIYTNSQFDAGNSKTTIVENVESSSDHTVNDGTASSALGTSEMTTTSDSTATATTTTSDDPSKTNPVVNAIDNKIEQAMDLVKSHLMYTVREEVEVLKEKIAELMERIQQLETENNYLRSQIPKNMILNNPIMNNSSNVNCSVVTTTPSIVSNQQTTNTITNNSNIGGNINETQQQQ